MFARLQQVARQSAVAVRCMHTERRIHTSVVAEKDASAGVAAQSVAQAERSWTPSVLMMAPQPQSQQRDSSNAASERSWVPGCVL